VSIRPVVVAAALVGACLTAFLVAALAFASGSGVSAVVTLQVAPRGLGTVTITPPDLNSTSECTDNFESGSCPLTYNRGDRVTLTASSDSGRALSSWSTPDCPGTGACTLTLDDDTTSVVALFNPLRLGVMLSSDGAGTVTADPAGTPCSAGDAEQLGDGVLECLEYAPGTKVKLTVANANGTFDHWNPGCEPTNAPTCTITVDDEPTWAGAHFVGDQADLPQLPTTISVQFRLKRGGTGGGRVSATDLDCGTVCSRQYDYGKSLTLTALPDQGSVFSGWNGVCSKTETKCTFPVGPITAIKAIFDHDSSPPSSPGVLSTTSATRTGIQISWTASTDNVSVAGYRVYLNDATAGDTTGTTYTFANLLCGHQYSIAVDAADEVGNRSPRATITGSTQACRLAARLAGVGIERRRGARNLVVKLRVNRPTSALLALAGTRTVVAHGRYTVKPGTNVLRLAISQKLKSGAYRLKVTLVDPDGGTMVLPSRAILLPRPR
jgi:Divergent InlB B-repeat domain/Fibronectin type III domain